MPSPSSRLDAEGRDRLVEASRRVTVGRILPSLIHRLSTPLASISLRSEGLLRLWSESEPGVRTRATRYLEAIVTETGALRDLLSVLRDLARPASAEPEAVDLAAACHAVAQLVLDEAMRRQVAVRLDVAKGLPAIQGQGGRLRQALLALVLNALDASPDGGRIDVRARLEEGSIEVEVVDAGPGIPPEIEPRLGQPFCSTRPDGLGLGLYSCRIIAEAHRGSLAWRAADAGGMRFTLRVPVSRPAVEKA